MLVVIHLHWYIVAEEKDTAVITVNIRKRNNKHIKRHTTRLGKADIHLVYNRLD